MIGCWHNKFFTSATEIVPQCTGIGIQERLHAICALREKEGQDMEKLFAALRDLAPGKEVLDVRFLTNQGELGDRSMEELDAALAACLHGAEPADIASLS